MKQKARLQLSTGHFLEGTLIGAPVRSSGELVFTTAMVGYGESITDPSYMGQILVFAYPLIGNYGLPDIPKAGLSELTRNNIRGIESGKVHLSGVIVSSDSNDIFHYANKSSLDEWLKTNNTPGIMDIDTRMLVHLIRDHGEVYAKIIPENPEYSYEWPALQVFEKSFGENEYFKPKDHNLIPAVSNERREVIGNGKIRIGVLNSGVKWNILRKILSNDCQVHLLPWNSKLSDIDCDAFILSNGPGDPRVLKDSIQEITKILIGDKPILGICLGSQLMAMAAGASIEKLKFGHRGHNHPIYEVGNNKGFISSQNHGYVIDEKTLKGDWKVWFRNANDESVEGIKHTSKPFWGVQFHPEASGGANDTNWIIDDFLKVVKGEGNLCQLDVN